MLKKLLFAILTLTISLIIYMIYQGFSPKSEQLSQPIAKIEEEQVSIYDKKPKKRSNKLIIKQDKKILNNIDQELSQLHKEYYFENIPIDEMALEMKYREFVKPIGALKMDATEFKNLHVGNKIIFTDIDNMTYEIILEAIEPMDGSQSLFGSLNEYGIKYPCIVTIGEDENSYIHLSTPNAIYEIELKKGKGYIYNSSDIRRILSDETIDDTLR